MKHFSNMYRPSSKRHNLHIPCLFKSTCIIAVRTMHALLIVPCAKPAYMYIAAYRKHGGGYSHSEYAMNIFLPSFIDCLNPSWVGCIPFYFNNRGVDWLHICFLENQYVYMYHNPFLPCFAKTCLWGTFYIVGVSDMSSQSTSEKINFLVMLRSVSIVIIVFKTYRYLITSHSFDPAKLDTKGFSVFLNLIIITLYSCF